MPIPGRHRHEIAVDCECGLVLEADDDDELLDELLEHIAATHEAGLRREPAAMIADGYDT